MDDEYKEVDFFQYCPTCKHKDINEVEDPCNECMDEGWNVESHKPVRWEENGK